MVNFFGKPKPNPLLIDWSPFQDEERSLDKERYKLNSEVRAVRLLLGKDKTNMLLNHWSVHLQLRRHDEIRLDMTYLDNKPEPGGQEVRGSMTTQSLRVTVEDKACDNPLEQMGPWIYREDQQQLVLSFQPEGKPQVVQFLTAIDAPEFSKPLIKNDGTNGCADWSAKAIDLFLKLHLIKADVEDGDEKVVSKYNKEGIMVAVATKKGRKTRCGLDFPIESF